MRRSRLDLTPAKNRARRFATHEASTSREERTEYMLTAFLQSDVTVRGRHANARSFEPFVR